MCFIYIYRYIYIYIMRAARSGARLLHVFGCKTCTPPWPQRSFVKVCTTLVPEHDFHSCGRRTIIGLHLVFLLQLSLTVNITTITNHTAQSECVLTGHETKRTSQRDNSKCKWNLRQFMWLPRAPL